MRGLKSWASAAGVLVSTGSAWAVPRVNALYPVGGQRGKTITVTLSGEGLKDVSGVWLAQPGLTVTLQPGGDASTRTATVTIAPEATPGIYELRFVDATGLSNVRYFRVGTLPEVLEQEPNDTTPQAITLPTTINGRIAQNPDRDSYRFSAKAGQKIVCEIEGIRLLGQVGDSWLKGFLEVRDSTGKRIVSSEGMSDTYYRWDPTVIFTPERDGEYTVTFRDLNFRGDLRSVYRLSVGELPHATGLFPLGGQRGTTVSLSASGANLTAPAPFAIPTDAAEQLMLSACGALNTRPFQTSSLPDVLAQGENQTVPWPCVVNGRFQPGKRDQYRFKLDQKTYVALELFSRRLGTPADAELFLYDAKGNLIQYDDDSRGADGWIVRVLEPGEYAIAVKDLHGRGGPDYGYRLALAPAQVKLGATVTPDTATVARGKSVSLTVKLEREHWDEDTQVALEPQPGVSAVPLTIPKGKTEGSLTATFAADAPLGPIRFTVIATAKPGGVALRAVARGQETYNLQGTAFQRDTLSPVVLVTPPPQ